MHVIVLFNALFMKILCISEIIVSEPLNWIVDSVPKTILYKKNPEILS